MMPSYCRLVYVLSWLWSEEAVCFPGCCHAHFRAHISFSVIMIKYISYYIYIYIYIYIGQCWEKDGYKFAGQLFVTNENEQSNQIFEKRKRSAQNFSAP